MAVSAGGNVRVTGACERKKAHPIGCAFHGSGEAEVVDGELFRLHIGEGD